MAGHGCPLQRLTRPRGRVALLLRAHLACLPFALAMLVCCSSLAAELDVKLRVAWGGGEARAWQGSLRLSEGTIQDFATLGLEADSPGAMHLTDARELRIFPRMPRGYDGCDVHLVAPDNAVLVIELFADNDTPKTIEVPVAAAAAAFQNQELDQVGNRLLAGRSPGDSLRVKFDRPSLVFAPNEKFDLEVSPLALPLAAATTYQLSATILYARGDVELNRIEQDVRTDAAGAAPPLPLSLALPADEGVYDLRIALYPKRLTSSLVRGKPIAERKVQVVVIGPAERVLPEQAPWKTIDEFDPANSRWWERLTRIPSLRKMPAWSQQPIGSGALATRSHLGRDWVELPATGWQAYPLSITAPGRLHMLEIDYPSDQVQTLGVSLVEPNAAGQVAPIGLDSGLDMPATLPGQEPAVVKLRIPFWPQTKAPVVVLTNRRAEGPAVFGRIVVQAGPDELLPLPLPSIGSAPQRLLAAYFDKPLFPENFSASEGLDATTGRSLDDWQTFYDGGRRMVEYLKHSGYNAVVVTVACEGSAIYPSRWLSATPKYDTGAFFETGQDPVRKDVLEMLLRLCDRAGIQVIPAVQLSSPLPELEALRLLDPQQATGLEPVGLDGRTWAARHGLRRGMGAYYNPLDERVQQAIGHVVEEIADRYRQHPSLGGVALHTGPETFSLLSDDQVGFDAVTLAAFARDTGLAVPQGNGPQANERIGFFNGEGGARWDEWRAQRIGTLVQSLGKTVQEVRGGARLYLTSAETLTSRQTQQWLRPALPPIDHAADALRALGVDAAEFKNQPVILPRPQRLVVGSPSLNQSLNLAWNQSTDINTAFAAISGGAAMHYHEPAPLRLPAFDAVSPFGADKTHTWFVSQIAPAGAWGRQRFVHSLATLDARTIIDGGWMLPLGQEDSLRELADVYRRLPSEPFRTAEPRGSNRSQPLVVRTLKRNGKTHFYIVNDSPWPVTAEVVWQSPQPLKPQTHPTARQTTFNRSGDRSTLTVPLQPFDLVGGLVDSENAEVTAVRAVLPTTIDDELRTRIRDVRLRTNALRSPSPRDLVSNPSFELPLADGEIPGWVHARGEGVMVEFDPAQSHQGGQSLHVVSRSRNDGPAPVVWLRSEPFAAPTTGRLSVVAWLRVDDPANQPNLRMAIEGKLDGATYYRRANVGASDEGRQLKPLQKGWASYRFPLTDLPLTGLTDVRVGFDLMGEGEVWIDHVEVFDLWLEDNERDELLKNIAASDFQLQGGQVADCQQFLESYWPRFLRQFVTLESSKLAATPAPTVDRSALATPDIPPKQAATPAAEPLATPRTSVLDRVRSWWPRGGDKVTR